MLAVNKYEKSYIDTCRWQVEAQFAAYAKIRNHSALAFEQLFLKHMILALDRYFVHRTRALEKKDGNPLNEVRMLCTSITEGRDTLQPDSTIKYELAKAVLKLGVGDEIKLSVEGVQQLCRAFFKDLSDKFG